MLASTVSRPAIGLPVAGRSVAANVFKKKAPQQPNYKLKGKKGPGQQFDVKVPGGPKKKVQLGFTKANELFVGRLAMVGFALAVLGEATTGKGALAQLNVETGVPVADIEPAVVLLVVFNLVAALLPASGKFEEEEDDTRQAGSLQDPRVTLAQPKRFFGISGFGFTKANELFVGRVAQLGFAAALIGEAITGKGPLEQLGLETGVPLGEIEPLLAVSILFTFFAAINEGSGRFVPDDE